MLSAIAARKAAHAAKRQQSDSQKDAGEDSNMTRRKEALTPMSTSDPEQSPGIPVTSDSELAIPRKRKANRQDVLPKMVQKNAKRLKHANIGRTRYFETEQPLEDFNDDILQSEIARPRSRGSSPSEPVLDSIQENGLISGFVTEDPGPSRRFSPSRPILDSSEEEDGGLKQNNHYSPEKSQETGSIVFLKASHRLFLPRLDSNCFRLTSDDLRNMDVLLDSDNATGTLILLPPEHLLTFVGTASITLVQGTLRSWVRSFDRHFTLIAYFLHDAVHWRLSNLLA